MVVERKQTSSEGRKSNNFTRANPVSKLLFCWMMPTFSRGFQKELDLDDLSLPPKEQLSEQLGDHLEMYWFEEEKLASGKNRPPSLRRALIRAFIWDYMPDNICLLICLIFFKSLQPCILALLLQYFDKDYGVSKNNAYIYSCILIIMTLFTAVISRHLYRRSLLLGLRLKVACSSLVYRKIMRMDAKSLHQTAAGKLVNLLSNDISRFDTFLSYIPFIWIAPIQIIFVGYLMYSSIGWLAAVGMAAITLQTVPIQICLSRISARLRLSIAQKTDERVKIMNELINGIKVIKMYAWEKPFEDVVSASRAREISLITRASYVRAISCSFTVFTERTSLYITLLAYTLMGNPITSSVVFPLAQFFNILKMSLALWLPNGILMLSEAVVAVDRIRDFLVSNESHELHVAARAHSKMLQNNTKSFIKGKAKSIRSPKIKETGKYNAGFENDSHRMETNLNECRGSESAIDLDQVTANWDPERVSKTLNDITFKVGRGQLCVVIGSVGAGKSSLLQLLLGELKSNCGQIRIDGDVSYAPQEPWLFVGTVRQNILFGLPYDEKRYAEVTRVCAIDKDLKQFPSGDQTLVGERGISLSGGQRARINLARAIYRKADIYLLDDPLSAVDTAVGRQLFEECIKGYLKGQTRLLVTHQLHYLKYCDVIVLLKNGCIENIGTYQQLISSNQNFAKLLMGTQEDKIDDSDCTQAAMIDLDDALNDDSIPSKKKSEEKQGETLEEEEREVGSMSNSLYTTFWRDGNSTWRIGFVCLVLVVGQISATSCDYWVTFWTNQQYSYNKAKHRIPSQRNATFEQYARINNLNQRMGLLSTSEYLYVYTGLIVLCIFLTVARAGLFFKLCMNSSKKLHDRMFHCLLRAVMPFFENNPSGRILNRFSKDVGTMDEVLPKMMMESLQTYLVMSSTIVLVTVSLPWTLLMATIVVIVFLIMLKIYLRSAQAIRRIEGVSKSPVFSHVTSTLSGMSTIRCTKSQQNFIKEFDNIQDVHTSTWNQFVGGSTTFGWWLDFVSIVFITIVIYAFLLIDEPNAKSGYIGLAISQALTLAGMLQATVNQTTEAISQMTSVERIRQYTKIQTEEQIQRGDGAKPLGWPSKGALCMRGVSLRYAVNKPLVLKEINVTIMAGWKVGIVGRTGAGKSSLITALFRLAKLEGDIEIDGVETGCVSLKELRASISIIPQEPVLFTASVRYNLDPFNEYDDTRLWEALEAVEMKDAVPSLDHILMQGGSNLSVGQRQLVCLARAILKNNKILVLDEATANVDPQTDLFIQNTIRKRFAKCTVLTIAHRLNTIMDSDMIMVMDFGEVVEFDQPSNLLSNSHGYLHRMLKELGSKTFKQLLSIAEESHNKNYLNNIKR